MLRQSNGSEDHVKNTMTTKLDDYFASGFHLRFGNHFDRFLVDFNIIQLAAEMLKFRSWDDLSEEKRTVLYRDYHARTMPDLEGIVHEPY